ncbi:hypothetical protein GCM10009747_24920 [Agromyces humatus]|uniref:Uncharacterized protein n=1 Tax=Agromyces humatus TaxID=279573 RepID=A0ABN2KRQ0_9MICO
MEGQSRDLEDILRGERAQVRGIHVENTMPDPFPVHRHADRCFGEPIALPPRCEGQEVTDAPR